MINIQFFRTMLENQRKQGKLYFLILSLPFSWYQCSNIKIQRNKTAKRMDKYNFNDIYMLATIRSARRDICI